MENGIKKWWLTMSEARLRRHLVDKLRYPAPLVETIITRFLEVKESNRRARIKHTVSQTLWDEYLEAPRYETAILRVIKSQMRKRGETDGPKWQYICAYENVINEVIEKLKSEATKRGTTPGKLPALLHEEGYTLPRNNGEHWTDYVKLSSMQRIRTMFISLPPAARGKHKEPFLRTLPPQLYRRKRGALIDELNNEIAMAEREREVVEHPDDIKRVDALLDDMYRAQFLLHQHTRKTPLPATWHGLLGDAKRK